jgi:hypothetical protein
MQAGRVAAEILELAHFSIPLTLLFITWFSAALAEWAFRCQLKIKDVDIKAGQQLRKVG